MPYVRIPDPKIIDLSAWHQVINVVNQHSDAIAAITNDFGDTYEKNWEGDDYSVQYDVSSQKIIYGRALLKPDATNNGTVWYETVTFTTPFSSRPVVTATILAGNDAGAAVQKEAIVSVYKLTTDGFSYRVLRPSPTDYLDITANIWVNWIAIGPR